MRRIVIIINVKIIGILLSFFFLSAGYQLSAQHTLTIKMTDFENNKGRVLLELLDENEETYKQAMGDIENSTCTIVIDDLKPGKYAIRYFHDEDSDGKLNKNLVGIPKEGYGFSNDAHGTMGPKDFKEWLFEVKSDATVQMETVYY
ncbi:MAG: DUF2141 domain-containing protein [Bacteroidota bacterium]